MHLTTERRSLYFLFAGTFFIFLNFNIAQIITPIYILDVGGTEFYSGLQSTLFYITAVLLRFFFGPLADSKGNRITLFIGGLAFMTAPVLFLFNQSVTYIILVRMYQAIGLAAYFSSASAMVSVLAPKEKLGTYIGFYRLVTMTPLMMGPSIALKVIKDYSYDWYHFMGIIAGLLAMIFLHFVREPHTEQTKRADKHALTDYNMLDLLKRKRLIPIYQSIFIVAIIFGLIQTFTAIYIEHHASDINPGIFFVIFGIGSIISNLTTGVLSDRQGRAKVVYPCILIMALGVGVLYFLPGRLWIIYAGSLLAGFGYAGAISVLITWVIDVAPLARRTTALALQDSTIDIGIALGSFMYGILIPIIGISWPYGISGGLMTVFALWKLKTVVFKQRKQ